MSAKEMFLEVLERFGVPTTWPEQPVAMHVHGTGGHMKAAFYGVEKSIPEEIAAAIAAEVVPALYAEGLRPDDVTFSAQVLAKGEPERRQARWNLHCVATNHDADWATLDPLPAAR